jgi:hypothetical protein
MFGEGFFRETPKSVQTVFGWCLVGSGLKPGANETTFAAMLRRWKGQ